jgi:hypothetical protein
LAAYSGSKAEFRLQDALKDNYSENVNPQQKLGTCLKQKT